MVSPDIFRANDIRGHYPKDFDLSFTKDLAKALCCLSLQRGIIQPAFLVGRDARLSSLEISRALLHELRGQGACVFSIGLVPSPLCYFLLNHYELPAIVVVTASHNPPEDNGFKILFHKKHKLFEPIKELKQLVFKPPSPVDPQPVKGLNLFMDKSASYIASLKKEFPRLRPRFSFALDTGNGALGPLAKEVFSALGLKPKILFCKPNGRFPHHHPDPSVEKNLKSLKTFMKTKGLSLGMGFDGDGDRLVLVGPKGRTLAGDELGALFLKPLAKAARQQNKRPFLLADVKCSDWFFRKARLEGFKVKMAQSGHGRIRAEIEKTKAFFALELSGHIFFNDRPGRGFDDALYASLRVLEILQGLSPKDIDDCLPRASGQQSPEIRQILPSKKLEQTLDLVRSYLTKKQEAFNNTDGVRISRKHSWALIRVSQTQSVLSMRFGADTQKELDQIKKEFAVVIGQAIP